MTLFTRICNDTVLTTGAVLPLQVIPPADANSYGRLMP